MVWLWIGFVLFVLAMLAVDLGLFHRTAHTVKIREALIWSAVWIALALVFNVFVYFAYEHHWQGLGLGYHDPNAAPATQPATQPAGADADATATRTLSGRDAAILFFTGYVIEKSLSVDNLFVMAVIFAYFGIPQKYQHRVLFWGILGALIMRGVMIGVGAALIARFDWILYIFGVFLIWTGYKMLTADEDPDPTNNLTIRFARKYFPVTPEFHGQSFFVRREEIRPHEPVELPEAEGGGTVAGADAAPGGQGVAAPKPQPTNPHGPPIGSSTWVLTPLALALIVVETTDVVFAVDSIPAIFAITTDPFLVFTSNVFAILGLRALFFALAGILDKFKYLKVSLSIILALIGVKMLLKHWLHDIPGISFYTLGVVALILGAGVVASIVAARRNPPEGGAPGAAPGDAHEGVALPAQDKVTTYHGDEALRHAGPKRSER